VLIGNVAGVTALDIIRHTPSGSLNMTTAAIHSPVQSWCIRNANELSTKERTFNHLASEGAML
jgi:hypothetical protein